MNETKMIEIIAGVILLYLGAESLVRGSSRLAARFGIPPLIIGLTIVAFGTSAPELLVSLSAALKGANDVAVGNVIGSNIFNIAVILGLTAVLRPPSVHLDLIRREIPFLIVVSLVLLFIEVLKATRTGSWSVIDHMLSMFVFVAFLVEFLLVRDAATQVFFILMVIAFIDVIAGFSVSIRSG